MSYVDGRRRTLRRIAMGSNQSMPLPHRVVARSLSGVDALPTVVPVRRFPPVKNRKLAQKIKLLGGGSDVTALGSLGDDVSPSSESTPSIGVDPLLLQQQQLAELQKISAAQAQFVKNEDLQRWFQIGATLAIPLSAAIWRAIFRGGRGGTKDFE